MNFTYFQGPTDEMSNFISEKTKCSICGEIDFCFSIEYSTVISLQEDGEEKVGCYKCLREGKFEFWHDTEFGLLDEKGLRKAYSHNLDNTPPISEERLNDLRRTPQFTTWQQELWLTHCNDFMIYKGTWEPNDFYNHSKDGDGRKLFLEMTDEEWNHVWDESLEENETTLTEWHATYYVFECKHCGKLRGNWDCD